MNAVGALWAWVGGEQWASNLANQGRDAALAAKRAVIRALLIGAAVAFGLAVLFFAALRWAWRS